ncbi:type 4 pilus assembly protein PilN [Vibrio azureus NBRC 104587]|uniref:Type 4 pilus assembly protein PilN n=1 Tax=Vibrio azureus NBRC 104587 TaxID=1219077 RepID=U3CFB7_9VIBR|nr:type 4 pilus assembly protein PilN [Vibrio azureus NBRC 104587]
MSAIVIVVFTQWLASQYLQYQQRIQQQRLTYLNDYITQLDQRLETMKTAQLAYNKIIERLKFVETLQNNRNKTTQLMNMLPSVVPQGVYVDKIKMNAGQVEMTGIAESTPHLTMMLNNLEQSEQLHDVRMHSIVHDKLRFGKKFQVFSLSFLFNALQPREMTKRD